jgi:flavin reductase (DIM6/NTAB) family NADH-FMN oxidoreductase RutF
MSSDPGPLARALGRIPTGLYLVAARDENGPVGYVGSFLMQVGLAPPTLCVAVGKDRRPLQAIRQNGRFGVSILDPESRHLMNPFFKAEVPFDLVPWTTAPGGSPVLSGALAWLECEVTAEQETGDHVVLFGEVSGAALLREGDPSIHLRRNGLGY